MRMVWEIPCNLAAKDSALEFVCVNNDNFTVLVSGERWIPLSEQVYCVAVAFKMTEQVDQ